MAESKTIPNEMDVSAFLNCVKNQRRAADARQVSALMAKITGEPPQMWGSSIIGFGQYAYKRKDGSDHTFMLTGLSPRNAALTLYIMPGFDRYVAQLEKLGKHKHSVSCLYITQLKNIDMDVLAEIITDSVTFMRACYP